MAGNFALPVTVTLDRGDLSPLDLTPMLEPGSLTWSSVVPGGFASCGFQINGDFRSIWQLIPYLSIVRVIGDSGRVLFEGQIEDKQPTLSGDTVGVKVGAFGLQNALKEQSIKAIWSKRDLNWDDSAIGDGFSWGSAGNVSAQNPNLTTNIGQYDASNPSKGGVQVSANGGVSIANNNGRFAHLTVPLGLTVQKLLGTLNSSGTDSGSTKFEALWWAFEAGTWVLKASSTFGGVATWAVTLANPTAIRVGAQNASGGAVTLALGDILQFYDIRLLGVFATEDTTDGYFGDTLIRDIVNQTPALGQGVIASGSDFTVEMLDASVRRSAYDLLQEVAAYYSREWAVWENALLDWKTPQLQQNQWVIPIAKLTEMDLDASTVNSKRAVAVLYTDAASGLTNEATANSTDRRNPYVLRGRVKDVITDVGFTMTPNTAQQLATILAQEVGFGPVPASGTIALPGETMVDHASGRSLHAWEIRAGDNVTLPELPMADVFTQDGRGEVLFHVVSAEASADSGSVTLTLDSYGSKRSDVLLARLAAVTNLLGG